ncbi:uncharacterized protein K489DRAFT_22662 [Dissoconium aciculare CBS 342.82]|uniref:Uncharacterized protein n=1 Tax=Dissoconium aciculare CBS 342.82 TaxID=1314786 RepID=A0A6J3MIU9_9PEZI|nr:uncharacterized protein K489DRAFT_22662 [Dissoconium aciculare CBS 342.82]KAF1827634.1 hypothetical protein K489DRAFT_22662 [Dissoconium aciculare CBS 342.82]
MTNLRDGQAPCHGLLIVGIAGEMRRPSKRLRLRRSAKMQRRCWKSYATPGYARTNVGRAYAVCLCTVPALLCVSVETFKRRRPRLLRPCQHLPRTLQSSPLLTATRMSRARDRCRGGEIDRMAPACSCSEWMIISS